MKCVYFGQTQYNDSCPPQLISGQFSRNAGSQETHDRRGAHMCAADAFQQQSGDLSLSVELCLSDAKFMFCLQVEMKRQY